MKNLILDMLIFCRFFKKIEWLPNELMHLAISKVMIKKLATTFFNFRTQIATKEGAIKNNLTSTTDKS